MALLRRLTHPATSTLGGAAFLREGRPLTFCGITHSTYSANNNANYQGGTYGITQRSHGRRTTNASR